MKKQVQAGKTKSRGRKRRANGRAVSELLKLPYKIELTPLSKADGGGYLAVVPLLKGCQSDGGTPDEAIQNLRESQRAWFASALKHNDPIPHPQ
jgi:predicted RNase H-like HicB family nuclease